MKTRLTIPKIHLEDEFFAKKKIIVFTRYCGNCGQGFYLHMVLFNVNHGFFVCPECYPKKLEENIGKKRDYSNTISPCILWMDKKSTAEAYERKLKNDLKNLNQ